MKNYIEYYKNNPFTYNSKRSILEEKDIGISADIASMMTPPASVSVEITGDTFKVTLDGKEKSANIEEAVTI